MRIVSLLPSATEILCSLGLRPNLVGITHECDYPKNVIDLPIVTKSAIPHDIASIQINQLVNEQLTDKIALYSINVNVLEKLQPDIIVTQGLCEVCAVSEADIITAIQNFHIQPKVINLEPMCLQDVFDTLYLVGETADCEVIAKNTVDRLLKRVSAVRARTKMYIKKTQYPKIAFFEWIDPLFNAGHWTPELIEIAGGIDCFSGKHKPSHSISWQTVVEAQPEIMFFACCGFSTKRALDDLPILQSNKGWNELPCVKNKRVYFSDGNAYFNRPGPRLVDSLEIIANALHPHIHPLNADILPAINIFDKQFSLH